MPHVNRSRGSGPKAFWVSGSDSQREVAEGTWRPESSPGANNRRSALDVRAQPWPWPWPWPCAARRAGRAGPRARAGAALGRSQLEVPAVHAAQRGLPPGLLGLRGGAAAGGRGKEGVVPKSCGILAQCRQ